MALGVGLLGLWRFHHTQFSSGLDIFPADRGDGRLITYLCEHWYQVFQNQASWRSPAMFYPVEGTLGYADMFLGYAVPFSILRALGVNSFTSLELVVILFNYLSYVVCFILLYRILRLGLVASCAGAFFFAFNSPKFVQMGHLQLQVTLFLPLCVIAVLVFVRKRESISQTKAFALLALAATSLSIQLMSGYYPGWFFIFWSFLFLTLSLCFQTTRGFVLSIVRMHWRAIACAALLFIVEMIPFLLVYVPVVRELGWRPYDSVKELIPVPLALLLTSDGNYVWGHLSASLKQSFALHPELQMGIGLVPTLTWLGLTVAALLFIRRYARKAPSENEDEARNRHNQKLLWLCLLVLSTSLFYLIGMKLLKDYSAWRIVYTFFPGGKSIRAVSRYVIMLALPMAIAFAFLIQHALDRIHSGFSEPRARVFPLIALFSLIGFGLFEQLGSNSGFSVRAENSYLERLSKKLLGDCRSFYLAVGPLAARNQFEYQIDAMMVSQMRGVPTMNGYSGVFPRDWFPALWEVKATGYEENMRRWIESHRLGNGVCRLVVDESVAIGNEIDDNDFFVRQQYLDILSREPDADGFRNWTGTLKSCPKISGESLSPACSRAHVVTGFLQSPEFSINYFIYNFYRAALGRMPTLQELTEDRQKLKGLSMPEQEAAIKKELLAGWMNLNEFKDRYGSLSDEEYVSRLIETGGISLPGREELVSALRQGRKQRAEVLQEFLESQPVREKFYNAAYVRLLYYQLFRREPDEAEYAQSLDTLDKTKDYRQLSDAFINADEYRRRFKPVY
ncbi:MAG: DUF4214 domain-containing protein [Pyrinomonadaceae bacterium]|nr:DUF4214 domain-containing protein [Pyrinomonadaceae bacterium]